MTGADTSQPAPVNDPALPLLSEVRFREDYRNFSAGETLTFEKGVNLLVGEQGSGKSTLITLLRDRVGPKFKAELSHRVMDVVMQPCYVRWLDFEKDNPRTQSEIGIHDAFLLGSMSVSHGQTMLAMLHGRSTTSQPCFSAPPTTAIRSSPRCTTRSSSPRSRASSRSRTEGG